MPEIEWLPPMRPGPQVPRWQRDLIQLSIMLAGVALAAWRLWGCACAGHPLINVIEFLRNRVKQIDVTDYKSIVRLYVELVDNTNAATDAGNKLRETLSRRIPHRMRRGKQ